MSKYAPGYTGPTTPAGPLVSIPAPSRPKRVAPKGTGPADGNPRNLTGMTKGNFAGMTKGELSRTPGTTFFDDSGMAAKAKAAPKPMGMAKGGMVVKKAKAGASYKGKKKK